MRRFVKKALSAVLSVAMLASGLTVTAPQKVSAANSFTTVGGWNESLYATISGVTDSQVKGVSYSGTMNGTLTGDDFIYLVRDVDGSVRIDIPGLKAGTYTLTVTTNSGTYTQSDITVTAYDRSGYAHFNYTDGVGAYNDDGTLKDNAIVLYVTDENKNTVSVKSKDGTTVTGIGNILNSAGQDVGGGKGANGGTANSNQGIIKKLAQDGTPLVVRFIGEIHNLTDTSDPASTQLIDGLTEYNTINYGGTKGDGGSMARMKSGKDITLEGIGADAVIDGWGFHFMCESSAPELGKSFEVRNLSFTNVPEDSVGMEGVQASANVNSTLTASVERCWIHNCSFKGANFSHAAESDKTEGDGSVDFKRGQYLTVSYCYFEGCHKTNLVGSADSSLQYNLTYHHNYWYMCKARGPLTRNANVHMYNNVFYGQTDYAMNTRANAYIFSESNLFYMCKSPQAVESGAIKSYNDSFSSYLSNKGSMGTVVSNKSQVVDNNCKFASAGINYSKFDTDSSLSYIPSGNYQLQEDLTEMRKVVTAYAGAMKENPITPDEVTLSSISVIPSSVTAFEVPGDQLPYTIEQSSIGKKGKVEKTMYAFTIPTLSDVTISYASDDLSSTGVLVNEAGVAFLTGSGTAYSLPAGTYAIQSSNFEPGDSATLKVGTFKSVTVNSITVASADPNYDPYVLTGIKMNESSATLLVGGTASLSAVYVPSSARTTETTQWTSSDESVATVSANGLVTAKKVGTATITAKVGDFTATCKIKVTEPIKVTGILIGSEELTLTAGTKSSISSAVTPSNTTDSYEITWSSDNTSAAKVDDNGNVTAVAEGTAKLTATVKVDGEVRGTAVCNVTVEKGKELPASEMAHNFTTNEKTSSFYTIAGDKLATKYSTTYMGAAMTKSLKMNSKGSVKFTAPSAGTLTLVFAAENSGNKLKINNDAITLDATGIVTKEISAGEVTIVRTNGESNLFYIAFETEGSSSSGSSVDITGVSLNKTSASLKIGETVNLEATVAPDNTTESKSVNWSSSNPAVATVKAGKVTAVAAGSTTITATSVGDSTKYAECTITVTSDQSAESGNTNNSTSSSSGNVMITDETTGDKYWYEDGVQQGTTGRGKEIYDPDTNAWYFLDAEDGGKVATSKDVVQPTNWDEYNADPAGYEQRAAEDGSMWKWVRYDSEGKMIKGWCSGTADSSTKIDNASDAGNEATYYFDPDTGEMAKGDVVIDNVLCHFDEATGVGAHYEWKDVDGVQYWYENGVRQGTILNEDRTPNLSYRGKEVFATDLQAWCWLDNVDYGKRAVSKDVYQESDAGDWGEIDNGDGTRSGKWVRYDSEGRMIKGWSAGYGETAREISSPSEANGEAVYYFDKTYGTMAKGTVTIDGVQYTFDTTYGTLIQ